MKLWAAAAVVPAVLWVVVITTPAVDESSSPSRPTCC
jgi:hypothetical protein